MTNGKLRLGSKAFYQATDFLLMVFETEIPTQMSMAGGSVEKYWRLIPSMVLYMSAALETPISLLPIFDSPNLPV